MLLNAGELFTATVGIPVVEPPEEANRVNLGRNYNVARIPSRAH